MKRAETPILAYYFPDDVNDPHRRKRAKQMNTVTVSDRKLAARRGILYAGLEGTSGIPWEMALAREYGVDGFIVDTYVGSQAGNLIQEFGPSLDTIARRAKDEDLLFCSMYCLKLARAEQPISRRRTEDNRWLELNSLTAAAIVDRAAELWDNPQQLRFDNKPYLSLYGLAHYQGARQQDKRVFVEKLRSIAWKKYRTDLYIVGIVQTIADIYSMDELHIFDGLTQYAGLPDFSSGSPAEQEYSDQLRVQADQWLQIIAQGITNFIPSVSIGWDASIRGESIEKNSMVPLEYPHVPIISNDEEHSVRQYYLKLFAYFLYTGISNRYIPVFAFNEYGENAALMPQIRPDESLDFSKLELIRTIRNMFSYFLS